MAASSGGGASGSSGSEVTHNDEGDQITVVFGEEKVCPRQYHVLTLGPFTCTTTVKKGETREQAIERAEAFLRKHAQASYRTKLADYQLRLKEL